MIRTSPCSTRSWPQAGNIQLEGWHIQLQAGPPAETYNSKVETYNSRLAQTHFFVPTFLDVLLVCAGRRIQSAEIVQEPDPDRYNHDVDPRFPEGRQASTSGGATSVLQSGRQPRSRKSRQHPAPDVLPGLGRRVTAYKALVLQRH